MQRRLPELRRRGARVVAVGQGTGRDAARFCRMLRADFPCHGDPGHEGYRALALERGGWFRIMIRPFLLDPRTSLRRLRSADLAAARSRHSDVLQLGGVAVVDGEGRLRFLHRAKDPADLPSEASVLEVLDQMGTVFTS